MGRFRQHLRLFSAAWIVFQVTSLSTLVPRACCLAHQSASAAKPAGCHEEAGVPQPTSPANETALRPMHHDHGQMQEQAAPTSSTPTHDCVLRGTCGGPTAALLALLSTHGVLTESIASPTDFPLAGKPSEMPDVAFSQPAPIEGGPFVTAPGGKDAIAELARLGQAAESLKDQYRHCKPILALGAAKTLLEGAGVLATLPSGEEDPGVLIYENDEAREAIDQFVKAIAAHRHFARHSDPPVV